MQIMNIVDQSHIFESANGELLTVITKSLDEK
jgi:hypothetical protein